jgi:hypothetical protein
VDTARQILRFSIPGSIFLLHGSVCYLVYRRLQGTAFIDSSTLVKENVGALVAVLATIPIGFVIYQAYYFSYEPALRILSPRWGGRLVRADRGWQILKTLDPHQVKTLEQGFGCQIDRREPHVMVPPVKHWYFHPWKALAHRTGMLEISPRYQSISSRKDRQEAFEEVWYRNWDVLRCTLDIAGSSPKSEEIKAEYTTLSDIYHSLGAARTAVSTAYLAVVTVALSHPGRIYEKPAVSAIGIVIAGILSVGLWAIFHSARGRTWRSARGSLQYGLRWLFWGRGDELKEQPLRD